jgi:hypothetical protein
MSMATPQGRWLSMGFTLPQVESELAPTPRKRRKAKGPGVDPALPQAERAGPIGQISGLDWQNGIKFRLMSSFRPRHLPSSLSKRHRAMTTAGRWVCTSFTILPSIGRLGVRLSSVV